MVVPITDMQLAIWFRYLNHLVRVLTRTCAANDYSDNQACSGPTGYGNIPVGFPLTICIGSPYIEAAQGPRK